MHQQQLEQGSVDLNLLVKNEPPTQFDDKQVSCIIENSNAAPSLEDGLKDEMLIVGGSGCVGGSLADDELLVDLNDGVDEVMLGQAEDIENQIRDLEDQMLRTPRS